DRAGVVTVSDTTTGQLLLSQGEYAGGPHGLALSPDGKYLAAATWNNSAVVLLDAATGRQARVFVGLPRGAGGLAFSPDVQRLAAVCRGEGSKPGQAMVWDTQTARVILSLSGDALEGRGAWTAFSPDGQRLVTTIFDKSARVWDVQTGSELFTLTGHT